MMYIRGAEYLPCKIISKRSLKNERLICLLLLPAAGGIFWAGFGLIEAMIRTNYSLGIPVAVVIATVFIALMKRIEILSRKLRSTIDNAFNVFTDDAVLSLVKGKKERDFYSEGGYHRIFIKLQQIHGDHLKTVLTAGNRDMELMQNRNIPTRMKIRLLYRYLQSMNEI